MMKVQTNKYLPKPKCQHPNPEITSPCCGPGRIIECGCQGMYQVWCNDCQNEELSDAEASAILKENLDYDSTIEP